MRLLAGRAVATHFQWHTPVEHDAKRQSPPVSGASHFGAGAFQPPEPTRETQTV
jgi:hypothetical protein